MAARGLISSTAECHRDGEGADGPSRSQRFNVSECLLLLCFRTSVLAAGFHSSNKAVWWVLLLPGSDQTLLWVAHYLPLSGTPKTPACFFFFWNRNPLSFHLKWILSIFNRVCWKLVNQGNSMRSLRNTCAWHNCIKSNYQRRDDSTREVKWGVVRRLFHLTSVKVRRLELFPTPRC